MSTRYVWQKFSISAEISLGPVGYRDETHGKTGNDGQDKYFDFSYSRSKSVRAYYRQAHQDAKWELIDPEVISGSQGYGASATTVSMDGYYWLAYGVSGYGGTLSIRCGRYNGSYPADGVSGNVCLSERSTPFYH